MYLGRRRRRDEDEPKKGRLKEAGKEGRWVIRMTDGLADGLTKHLNAQHQSIIWDFSGKQSV